jgi:hypothetical protein
LKITPAPVPINRLTRLLPQVGHFFTGGALID